MVSQGLDSRSRNAGYTGQAGRRMAAALAVAIAVVSPLALGSAAQAAKAPACSLGLQLSAPDAAVATTREFFVANSTGNTVTEVSGATGSCMRVFSGSPYNFQNPTAITRVQSTIYVANSDGTSSSLTEFNPTQSTATVLSGSSYGFDNPIALATSGTSVVVLNANDTVTEIQGTTATILGGSTYNFANPTSIAMSGLDIFVLNQAGGDITEINTGTTPASVRMLTAATYGFNFTVPSGTPVAPSMTVRSGALWVTNPGSSQVNEIKISTLAQVMVINNSNLAMSGPILNGGTYLYTSSPPGGSPMISQITASSGSVNWMMCNTNANYYFNDPQSLVVSGGHLWIVNEGGVSSAGPSTNTNGPSLTEMDPTTGSLLGYFT
jgi:hypothetical protein